MKRYVLMLILFFFLCSTAYAEDFNALVDEAEKSYKAGDTLKSIDKLKEAILSIWDDLPLTVKNARLITDKGNYEPRSSNVYGSGEKIYITARLLGYKIKKSGGLYVIDIATDFYVLDDKDSIVGGKRDFGKFTISSPFKNTEFKFDLTYILTDAPKGGYKIQTVIRDLNSGKTTDFTKDIRIR